MMISKRTLHQLLQDQSAGCQLQTRIDQLLKQTQASLTPFALVFIDLGYFGDINGSLGPDAGDWLLVQVAKRLKDLLKQPATLCHYSGDRFMLLVNGKNRQQLEAFSQQLIQSLTHPYRVATSEVVITANIGITFSNNINTAPQDLIHQAEIALQGSRRIGRNTCHFYSTDLQALLLERHHLRNQLHQAMDRREFWLAYQPIIQLNSLQAAGMECLLRWRKPQLGNPGPDQFIPLAEESGLIHPLGNWVLQQAMDEMHELLQQQTGLRLAINLSPRQFWDQQLGNRLLQQLETLQLLPTQLELEITEGTALQDPDTAIRLLNELKRAGISLAMDDFGTGYSSLAYLQDLPVNRVKLDRHFVQGIGQDQRQELIITSLVRLAKDLGKEVVAEGVETDEQLAFLQAIGCPLAQGYFFARPMPGTALQEWYQDKNKRRD
ncbi:putative bifunctional diguanylate cyclase/phosphodiesterase [Marinospirillum alkaliphilum]|uniref:Diguanylate cyclase (GGDEF) domain-containing protein n=1 Tax=Marinospirillum alkaliphilum DSM 21637 TaxID=1122209 RepID=A0A1K1YMK1_9GAMM|nr:bifunctional diguanylate cyclase/phosphodiesterase [Marinospirillum alkaliphilum]SFX63040.1 diguanylate cyclase (GGDEF) domain-containing protein [Marinospirillum alkaliphilum DSM 21637]